MSEYSIAAGYNNEAGLDLIEDILVSGQALHSSVTSLGSFEEGLERGYLNGLVEDTGFAEWSWVFTAMTPDEYQYIKDTYLGGQRSGFVTVRTKNNGGNYANYNAVATLQKNPRLDAGFYVDVEVKFTQGDAL